MNTRSIGALGEDAACQYLEENGYHVVGRNVYAGGCEADILAEDDEHFLFVEVKSRRAYPHAPDKFGRPANAVTPQKRTHMLTMAKAYLHEHPEITDQRSPRLDVIEVYLSPMEPGVVLAVEHFPNAVREKANYDRKQGYRR